MEQVLALRDSYTLSLHSMLKEFQTKLQKHSTRVSKNIFSEIQGVRGIESTRWAVQAIQPELAVQFS